MQGLQENKAYLDEKISSSNIYLSKTHLLISLHAAWDAW
jgi:hypothetical protein